MIPDRVADEVKKRLADDLELIKNREVEVEYPITKG
jgi:hypothetical protein